MEPIKPFVRRRAPGKYGGKPVKRAFYFASRDGNKYPSESPAIRNNKLPDDPNKMMSWSWALSKASSEDLWLVIPCHGIDEAGVRLDISHARASVWKTARRAGIPLSSEYVYPNLYIKVVTD